MSEWGPERLRKEASISPADDWMLKAADAWEKQVFELACIASNRGMALDVREAKIKELEQEIERLKNAAPDGYALVAENGAFVGAWRTAEAADMVRARSPRASGERTVPFQFLNEVRA